MDRTPPPPKLAWSAHTGEEVPEVERYLELMKQILNEVSGRMGEEVPEVEKFIYCELMKQSLQEASEVTGQSISQFLTSLDGQLQDSHAERSSSQTSSVEEEKAAKPKTVCSFWTRLRGLCCLKEGRRGSKRRAKYALSVSSGCPEQSLPSVSVPGMYIPEETTVEQEEKAAKPKTSFWRRLRGLCCLRKMKKRRGGEGDQAENAEENKEQDQEVEEGTRGCCVPIRLIWDLLKLLWA